MYYTMSLTKSIQITLPITTKNRDLIAVERSEWNRLNEQLMELAAVVRIIAAGEREWRTGKTKTIKSLKELL